MKHLILATLLVISTTLPVSADPPKAKQWYSNPDTTTVPDNAKWLMHDPNTVTDHTVTTSTHRNTILRLGGNNSVVFRNNSSHTVACVKNSGVLVIGPGCETWVSP